MSARQPLEDIAFISEFAAFCRSKGDETYGRCDAYACALAQFGHPGVQFTELRGVPEAAFQAALEGDYPARFSALAGRLEALLIDAPAGECGQ